MDEKSLQYIDFVTQWLTAFAETNNTDECMAFVAAELMRLGLKPKTVSGGLYCDWGRAKTRTAFYAELGDVYQTTVLMCLAAELAKNGCVGVRLIFEGYTSDELDLFDETHELYSVATCGDLRGEAIGCCYGVACAGLLEFSLNGIGGEWTGICAAVDTVASQYGLQCKAIGDNRFALRYFDKAKCESVLLAIERWAQTYDDSNGTEHVLTVDKNYPPLKNDALCVDKVRYAADDKITLIPSSEMAHGVSRYLDNVDGCMVSVGNCASIERVVRLFERLACGAQAIRRLNG